MALWRVRMNAYSPITFLPPNCCRHHDLFWSATERQDFLTRGVLPVRSSRPSVNSNRVFASARRDSFRCQSLIIGVLPGLAEGPIALPTVIVFYQEAKFSLLRALPRIRGRAKVPYSEIGAAWWFGRLEMLGRWDTSTLVSASAVTTMAPKVGYLAPSRRRRGGAEALTCPSSRPPHSSAIAMARDTGWRPDEVATHPAFRSLTDSRVSARLVRLTNIGPLDTAAGVAGFVRS